GKRNRVAGVDVVLAKILRQGTGAIFMVLVKPDARRLPVDVIAKSLGIKVRFNPNPTHDARHRIRRKPSFKPGLFCCFPHRCRTARLREFYDVAIARWRRTRVALIALLSQRRQSRGSAILIYPVKFRRRIAIKTVRNTRQKAADVWIIQWSLDSPVWI